MTNAQLINQTKKVDLKSALEATDNLLFKTLSNTPKPINHITKYLANTYGKNIRSKLLLISSMDDIGLIPQEAISASVAIEILHLATLVHDDIIDNSDLRRGKESVQSKFSKKEAVICGDYLFCMSFSTISNIFEPYIKFIPKFALFTAKICLGELEQLSHNRNIDMTFYNYLKIINGKTASLFHMSAYGGALLSKCSEKEARNLGRFGSYLGMIFQILDDCKDYKFNESEALKPVRSDILAGIINLPLLMSFLKEPELRQTAKQIILEKSNITNLIDDIYRLKGVESSVNIAKKYTDKSTKILNAISNEQKSKELLKLLNSHLKLIDSFM